MYTADPLTLKPSKTEHGVIKHRIFRAEDYDAIERARVLIIHGMCEHQGRYLDFAEYLAGKGFTTLTFDLPGHGDTCLENDGIHGHFEDENGAEDVVADINMLIDTFRAEGPAEMPFILFGHSMGSMLARYISARRHDLDAAVYSGTPGHNGALPLALFLSNAACKLSKPYKKASIIDKLAHLGYLKLCKHEGDEFCWLSRDKEVVQAYHDDPQCGFVFSKAAFRDMFTWYSDIDKDESIAAIDTDMPILLVAGGEDPVVGFKEGITDLYNRFRDEHDADLLLYANGRHEMLNEINRDDVYRDIELWMEAAIDHH